MIVIVGESASGKTTLQNEFIKRHPEYSKVVTYTTRPPRPNEQNGIDYRFVNNEEFAELKNKGFFAETNKYRGWGYGSPKADYGMDNKVCILTPSGLRSVRRAGYEPKSVYLYVDQPSRLIQSICRGDDIEEAYRRSLSDVGMFDGIVDEVDCVIDNTKFHMDEQMVVDCLDKFLGVTASPEQTGGYEQLKMEGFE